MYKIALICQFGASTGMLKHALEKEASNRSIDMEVAAFPEAELDNIIDYYDFILVAPQMMYKFNDFKTTYESKANKLGLIEPVDFGMMNAEKILSETLNKISN